MLDLAEDEADTPVGAVPAPARGLPRGLAAVGVLAAAILGFVLGVALFRDRSGEAEVAAAARVATAGVVELPATATIAFGVAPIGYDSPMLTLSDDGRHLVYVGRDGPGSRLYRHDLSTFGPPEPIPGTEGALHAFFSPVEPVVGFVTNDKLKRVDLNGDRLQVLGDVRSATRAIWGDDGSIYLGDSQARFVLRVPENGGEGELVADLPLHGLSAVLPGGTGVLYHVAPRGLRRDFGQVKWYDFATAPR